MKYFDFSQGEIPAEILLYNYGPLKVNKDGELKIIVNTSCSFTDSLILKNAVISKEVEFDHVNSFEYTMLKDAFYLELATNDGLVSIQFQGAEHIQEFYDYSAGLEMTITNNNYQWIMVAKMLAELQTLETNFGAGRLNDQEKELLPLTHFLPIMMYNSFYELTNHDESGISLFENYAKTCHAQFLIPSINRSHSKSNDKKISRMLRDKRCEPLWRQIFTDLKNAASVYPQKRSIDQDEADKIRNKITKVLLSQGFMGEYPDFRKLGTLKGRRLLENQSNTYFVSNEKNMASYIYCAESANSVRNFPIHFLCGTILLGKDQLDNFDKLDAYSSFFLDKGKRFSTVVYPNDPDFRDGSSILVPEAEVAFVAAKKACLQKISKEEKNKTLIIDNTSIFVLMILFTIIGTLLFGLAMTLGFMLIILLMSSIVTFSVNQAFEMFLTVPWHLVFLGTGLPFAVIMGTLTIAIKMKK